MRYRIHSRSTGAARDEGIRRGDDGSGKREEKAVELPARLGLQGVHVREWRGRDGRLISFAER